MSDYIIKATAGKGSVRAFACLSTKTCEEARKAHNTSPVVSAALGRMLSAGLMMGSMMKNDKDLTTLKIEGSGPMKGVLVTADNKGGVKGYPFNPLVIIPPNSKGKLDVAEAIGVGILTVISDTGLKEPYVGQVELISGEIAEDIAYYYASSEQVPSAVALGVLMNKDNTVKAAGGFIIQLMPGADEEVIEKIEEKIGSIAPVTTLISEGKSPEDILELILGDLNLEINEKIERESVFVETLTAEMSKVIIGQRHMVDALLIGLLGQGHILLEGVPGLAKTLSINTLAKAVHGSFSRIQFTPDLLPADVIGTMTYNIKQNEFAIKKGPVFANFVLADEINRAPAKVQSALLEAMQEKQVTIGDTTFSLDKPFLVMATQNPVEQEGTYPLPEAQVDRFMLKVVIDYPKLQEEQQIMHNNLKGTQPSVNQVVSLEQILHAQQVAYEVYMDEKIEKYILDIIFATRYPEKYQLAELSPLIQFGASPRGSISLAVAAKCHAFIHHRGYVIPEDVRSVIFDVLRHRIGITYEAEAENITSVEIINKIINTVEVP